MTHLFRKLIEDIQNSLDSSGKASSFPYDSVSTTNADTNKAELKDVQKIDDIEKLLKKISPASSFAEGVGSCSQQSVGESSQAGCSAPGKTDHRYYLFLLGTGVNFVEKPTTDKDKTYIRGNTTSYLAQLTTFLRGEKSAIHENADKFKDEHYAHAYTSDSVDVVNGADTLGSEVGDRLARAKLLALAAIGRGKTHLTVSGFSRGGVESIMLMYELNRFRKELRKDLEKDGHRPLAELCCDTDSVPTNNILSRQPSYTKAALQQLTEDYSPPDNETEIKSRLLANLEQLEVDLFVLDPVPGGNFAKVFRLGWQEEAFYQLPEFVNNKLALIQQHETSNCFRPIVPKDMPYEVIPGAHGTGDGNQFDHNYEPVSEKIEKRDLSGVQDLVIRRWLDFTQLTLAEDKPVELDHEDLDELTNEYLRSSRKEKDELLLKNYKQIADNYEAFEWLSTRCYAPLGRHADIRSVNYHCHSEVPITQLNPHGDQQYFINLQHIQLWMQSHVASFDFENKSLSGRLAWLNANIAKAFGKNDLASSLVGKEGIEVDDGFPTGLVEQTANHDMITNAVTYMVGMMMQQYLRNHLTRDQRVGIRSCVDTTTTLLFNAKNNPDNSKAIRNLAEKIWERAFEELTDHLLTHYHSKLKAADELMSDHEKLVDLSINPNSKDTSTRDPLTWLVEVQSLINMMIVLPEQVERLDDFCDKKRIDEELHTDYKGQVNIRIQLLKDQAAQLMLKYPEFSTNRPQELSGPFFDDIEQLAERLDKKSQADALSKTMTALVDADSIEGLSALYNQDLFNKLSKDNEENPQFITDKTGYFIRTMLQHHINQQLKQHNEVDLSEFVLTQMTQLSNIAINDEKPEDIKLFADNVQENLKQDLTDILATRYQTIVTQSNTLIWDHQKVHNKAGLEGFEDSGGLGAIDWLRKAQAIRTELNSLPAKVASLSQLCDTEKLDKRVGAKEDYELNLHMHVAMIEKQAAQKLVENSDLLVTKPDELDEAFYNQIKRLAISMGAPDPEKQMLEEQVERLKNELNNIEQKNNGLETQLINQQEQIKRQDNEIQLLESDLKQKSDDLQSLQSEVEEKKAELAGVNSQIAEKAEKIRTLNAAVAEKDKQCAAYQLDVKQKQDELNALQSAAEEKEREIENLKATTDKKEADLSELKANLGDKEDELESLKSIMNQQSQQLEDQEKRIEHQDGQIESLQSDLGQKNDDLQLLQSKVENQANILNLLKAEVAEKKAELEDVYSQIAVKAKEIRALNEVVTEKDKQSASDQSVVKQKQDELNALQSTAEEKAQEIDNLKVSVANNQALLIDLRATVAKQEADLSELGANLDDKEDKLGSLQSEVNLRNQQLNVWQSKSEQRAMVKIGLLQEQVNKYHQHLTEVLQKSPLDEKAQEKYDHVDLLKKSLEENRVLPSKRIEAFQQKLQSASQQLKEHRDPLWLRFLRDCLRIIGLTFSGVALYRAATGRSVHFFKPSHGEQFVEEASQISSPLRVE